MIEKNRIKYLDGIRGLAALAVFLYHYLGSFQISQAMSIATQMTPLRIFCDGYAAVSLFFVLSGLVLTKNYFHSNVEFSLKKEIIPFALSRSLRIYIPFLAAVLISAGFYFSFKDRSLFLSRPFLNQIWGEPLTFSTFLGQLILPFPIGGTSHLLPQDWTLTIEYNVSMLILFLVLLAMQGSFLFLFSMLLVTLIKWYMLDFALGLLLAKHFVFIQKTFQEKNSFLKMSLLILGLISYSAHGWESVLGISEVITSAAVAIGAALILAIAISWPSLQKILSKPLFLFLGRISFSLYLVHFIVIKVFSTGLIYKLQQVGIENLGLIHLLTLPLSIVVLFVFSEVFYRFIERPSVNKARQIKMYLNKNRAVV